MGRSRYISLLKRDLKLVRILLQKELFKAFILYTLAISVIACSSTFLFLFDDHFTLHYHCTFVILQAF